MATEGPQRAGQRKRSWVGQPQSHMIYLLTQVPTLGTVPRKEGPSVFQTMWNRASGTGAGGTGAGGAPSRFAWGAVSPQAWGTLFPASSAPETVKLIKAVEPQD